MPQVLSDFLHTFPGTVSRSIDSVIISLRNADSLPIPPGAPVFLKADGAGVVLTQVNSVFARFVGIAVRVPSATPETYGSSSREYAAGDPVDVLVRGCAVVALTNEMPEAGGAVHLKLADGTFTTEAETNATIQLENCSWRRSADLGDGCAEIVIRERNLV